MATVYTRLSSGLRINKAAYDAAGLAVSKILNVKDRVYGRGVHDLNDGIRALSIADSGKRNLSERNFCASRSPLSLTASDYLMAACKDYG